MFPSLQQQLTTLKRPLSNLFLTLPSAWTAEVVSHTGIDSLTIDLQHGLIDYSLLVPMLQAITGTGVIPMVRLQWNEPSAIMKVLDAGAPNLICPMINDREETEAFVEACYYPPRGNRSFGPLRAQLFTDDYRHQAENIVFPFAMIETADAVENLEAIAQTPGLKGLYVGPYDLTISLQRPKPSDFQDKKLIAILERVIKVCRRNGLVPGIFASTIERIQIAKDMGFQLISYGDDMGMFQGVVRERVGEMMGVLGDGERETMDGRGVKF